MMKKAPYKDNSGNSENELRNSLRDDSLGDSAGAEDDGYRKINKKALIRFIVWIVLMTAAAGYRMYLASYRETEKNAIRFLGAAVVVCFFFAIINLIRLLPLSLKDSIKEKLSEAASKLISRIDGMNRRRKKVKGTSKREIGVKIRLSDERKFIFDSQSRREAAKKAPPPKWKDMTDNAKKARFLYIRFISRLSKKGYRYSMLSTPYENGAAFRLKSEDGGDMFRIYTNARYSGGRAEVTDGDIEYSKECADFDRK